jgi:hypothetical protein
MTQIARIFFKIKGVFLMTVKKLPLGDHSFNDIIDKKLLYADKTRYIYDLIQSGKKDFFLSRPRRFGKSLLLSTIKELFSGRSKRFQGLWIDQSDYQFPLHPVLHLSLSMDSETPELLKENLLADLSDIAINAGLKLKNASLGVYFRRLIEALYKATDFKSKVVILIDEYDSPVTENMDNDKVTKANIRILRKFFATLKTVTDAIHFTFVTGITRYALTSMDSGPNHLNDISLDGRYAGICGFTTEEFGPLFADRMEAALMALKERGKMAPSADALDLYEKIRSWYDGYDWGGKTRVLNPYSLLNFFDTNSFSNYWFQSGRPGHLTSLMREKPSDFLDPVKDKDSYLSGDLRKSDLKDLQAVPVLFHSGYLTIDKIGEILELNKATNELEAIDTYSFRFPNFEVSTSYNKDCFSAIFGSRKPHEIKQLTNQFNKAFIDRNALEVSRLLFDYFSKVSFFGGHIDEKIFHAGIQFILLSHDFKVLPEITGADNRMDLCVELANRVFLIIELKFCSESFHLSAADKNRALADEAMYQLPESEQDEILVQEIRNKLSIIEFKNALSQDGSTVTTRTQANQILANKALDYLTTAEIECALAEALKLTLSAREIKEIEKKAVPKVKRTDQEIDDILTKAAQKALNDIAQRGYHHILDHMASEFIDLGLAIYGTNPKIKAAFGPGLIVT